MAKRSNPEKIQPPSKQGGLHHVPFKEASKITTGLYFAAPKEDITFISSGCTLLDLSLGGGWARRHISNIVGDSSTGKTLLAIEAAANFVREEKKGIVRYREPESAFQPYYAAAIGFPLEKVDFGDPVDTIEDIFEDLEKVIEGAKGPELYIIDSLDALTDREELERDIDQGSFGTGKAKKMSQLLRRQVRGLAEKDITLLIISQVRDNIGVMIGKKHKRSGGRALEFYSSQICWLHQIDKIPMEISGIKRIVGIKVKATMEKNKVGIPYRDATFTIRFGYGIDDRKACTEFLKQIGFGHSKNASMQDLRRMVEENWWKIERKFLPEELKYPEET